MRIINKNTDGVRTSPLQERDLMQELTPASEDYGKVSVGTDGTYEGEVVLAKDIDVKALDTRVTDETVKVSGDEVIAGVKTFASSPVVPTPLEDMEASTKKYVDTLGATVDEEVLRLDGRITAETQVAAGGSAIAMAIVFGS